jgi:hypothetical protein
VKRISEIPNALWHIEAALNAVKHISEIPNALQHIEAALNALQHIEAALNALQHISEILNALRHIEETPFCDGGWLPTFERVADGQALAQEQQLGLSMPHA